MTTFNDDFKWQQQFIPHYQQIALQAVSFPVASWEDDARRNTDLLMAVLTNGTRVACRARRHHYWPKYANEFTIRLDRPSGTETEIDKIRSGWGDFMIYGFEAEDGDDHLHPWVMINLHLLREHLDNGGRWMLQDNHDESSRFAAFRLQEMPLGAILKSDGQDLLHDGDTALGPCEYCGRQSWRRNETGHLAHFCCERWAQEATGPCPSCTAANEKRRWRQGWPPVELSTA